MKPENFAPRFILSEASRSISHCDACRILLVACQRAYETEELQVRLRSRV